MTDEASAARSALIENLKKAHRNRATLMRGSWTREQMEWHNDVIRKITREIRALEDTG